MSKYPNSVYYLFHCRKYIIINNDISNCSRNRIGAELICVIKDQRIGKLLCGGTFQ